MFGLIVSTPPAEEPVPRETAKLHCKIDVDDDDLLLDAYIQAARLAGESRLDQTFVTRTYELTLDRFPGCELELPRPPLQAVESIEYYDVGGTLRTLDAALYQVDARRKPGRLAPAAGTSWPATACRLNAVTIRYVAGYGDKDDVPENIRSALLLLVGHLYENREGVVVGTIAAELPFAVEQLLLSAWHGSYGYAGLT